MTNTKTITYKTHKNYKTMMKILSVIITGLNLFEVYRSDSIWYAIYTALLAVFSFYYSFKN
mgnify:FL=1